MTSVADQIISCFVGESVVDFLTRGRVIPILKTDVALAIPKHKVLIQTTVHQRCRTHAILASIKKQLNVWALAGQFG